MKETKYQELKKEIAELKEKQRYYDEYITTGIDPVLDQMEAMWERIGECEDRLDTWDRRLAKWAKKGGFE